jgi:hypothetical protein
VKKSPLFYQASHLEHLLDILTDVPNLISAQEHSRIV